jgi:hypothetical protein
MSDEEKAAAAAAEAAKVAAGDETWHSKLPEDLRANETLAQFKDDDNMISMPVSVAKSYAHVRTMVGADTIKLPKTDEDWEDVYTKLGRPDVADTYILQQAEGVNPDLKETLGKDAEWFRGTAHKLGLNDKQTTGLFLEFSKQMSDRYTEMQKTGETDNVNTEIQMRTEFGSAYEGKKVLTQRALRELGGQEFVDLIKAKGMSGNPTFIRAMFKVGDMMAEELGLDKATGQLVKSKGTVEGEKASLMAQPAYLDASMPEHKTLVQQVAVLNQQLLGKEVVPTSTGIF